MTAIAVYYSQQTMSNYTEYGKVLWKNEPAEKIFPKTLAGGVSSEDGKEPDSVERAQWQRLGISDEKSCNKGLSDDTARAAKRAGCQAVLRATYTDPTGNMVATIALIALPDAEHSQKLGKFFYQEKSTMHGRPGVRALAVPDTVAAQWNDDARNSMAAKDAGGLYLPYNIAITTGAADGRKAGELPAEWGEKSSPKRDRKSWTDAARQLLPVYQTYLDQVLKEDKL